MALKQELERQGDWLFRYRSILPLGILVIALGVFIQSNLQKSSFEVCTTYFEIGCLIVSLLGLTIRIYTVGYTPKNTSGRNTSEGQVAETLNTLGIYSMVRHPLYLGNFFMWLGPALLTANSWFIVTFILFYWIYYERIMIAEDQFLEKKFGKCYTNWAGKVPAFIPNPGLYQKAELSFSIKKVLKKEKNGLFAIFIIFAFFDVLGEWLKNHTHFNYLILIGCLISMLMYLVLKIMKSKTVLLNDNR